MNRLLIAVALFIAAVLFAGCQDPEPIEGMIVEKRYTPAETRPAVSSMVMPCGKGMICVPRTVLRHYPESWGVVVEKKNVDGSRIYALVRVSKTYFDNCNEGDYYSERTKEN